jgi:hypothetical protein
VLIGSIKYADVAMVMYATDERYLGQPSTNHASATIASNVYIGRGGVVAAGAV